MLQNGNNSRGFVYTTIITQNVCPETDNSKENKIISFLSKSNKEIFACLLGIPQQCCRERRYRERERVMSRFCWRILGVASEWDVGCGSRGQSRLAREIQFSRALGFVCEASAAAAAAGLLNSFIYPAAPQWRRPGGYIKRLYRNNSPKKKRI